SGSDAPSPGWAPGCESAWQTTASAASGSSNRGRRLSATSDSGDTGIGTSCSDSIEDHSSSSGTLSFKPIRSQVTIPTAHVMPSTAGSKRSPHSPVADWSSCHTLSWDARRTESANGPLDTLGGQGRCGPGEKACVTGENVGDRNMVQKSQLYYLQEPQNQQRALAGCERRYPYDLCSKAQSPTASPLKPSTLVLTYSALPETKPVGPGHPASEQRCLPLGHQTVGGSPIQPAVRTQMWLSEQMHSNPVEYSRPAPDGLCDLSAWPRGQQLECLRQNPELTQVIRGRGSECMLIMNGLSCFKGKGDTLLKVKEGLLRQKEMVIDRQKQQIIYLHEKIRENELRVQQVIQSQRGGCDDPYRLKLKESQYEKSPLQAQFSERSDALCCEDGELQRKPAAAELQVIHLNEFLKQNTQKYTEEIKKLEEKLKTRDKYISSLKKKCQRESEQNQEKQQRIETLEKYLADLPSLEDVQSQEQELAIVQERARGLQERVGELEKSLGQSRVLVQEKEALIESQRKKEKELVGSVQSLQQKVEQCLEDGVRLSMLDMKRLECDNTRLQEQHSQSTKIIDNQKKQLEQLTLELTATEKKLLMEKTISQDLRKQLLEKEADLQKLSLTPEEKQSQAGEASGLGGEEPPRAVGQLLREMALCLMDLRALCSILTQRAQGKEPNLGLLLGIKSMNCSAEENENLQVEDSLGTKLSEVCQLRKDIDELRNIISDSYAQDMGDNCITQ
ncbi:CE85L protein, partial [Amia calva]|nr:CE85L protein [Amia calva]